MGPKLRERPPEPAGTARSRRAPRAPRPPLLPLLLGVIALLAAVVGAVGPGKVQQSVYAWPPPVLPAASPEVAWYTPLVLALQQAQAVEATIPCDLPESLAEQSRVTVLATARNPESSRGLHIFKEERELVFNLGNDEFARARLPRTTRSSCQFDLSISGVDWRLDPPRGRSERGVLQDRPFVSSIFSGVDLNEGAQPTIRITTQRYGVQPSLGQQAAWVVAGLAALAALLLVSGLGRSTFSRLRRRPGRPALVDAVVVGVLVAWTFFGPSLFDDGWVKARQENFADAGRFSNYYDTFGTAVPLVYWLEWLQHWVVGPASSTLVMRLPTLLVLVITWACCRLALRWIAPPAGLPATAARWGLATAFLAGAIAWLMTLRPEFAIALLAAGSLLAALRFLARPSFGPIALGGVLVALAVTAHPAGLTVAAPLLAIAPAAIRWLRATGSSVWPALAAIGSAAAALVLLLVFVGTDLAQWQSDYSLFRKTQTHAFTWRDELQRYLDVVRAGSVIRKGSVVVFLLALAAYGLRRDRRPSPLLDLPAQSLFLGLVLLIPTPSKWLWHFGVLVAYGAVALAAETARAVTEQSGSAARRLAPVVALVIATISFVWAWSPRPPWGTLDLRTAGWTWPIESTIAFDRAALLFAGLVVAGLAAWWVRRRRDDVGFRRVLIAITVPLFVVPMIVFTFATFVRDAAITDGWTFSRQNLGDAVSAGGCGVADDLSAISPGSLRPLVPLEDDSAPTNDTGLLPDPPLADLGVVGGQEQIRGTSTQSPWYAVPANGPIGYFEHGFATDAGNVRIEWGERRGDEIEVVESEPVVLPVQSLVFDPFSLPWRFRSEPSLPARSADSVAVRLIVDHFGGEPISQTAVTAPLAYSTEPLARRLAGGPVVTLVDPQIRLYFPCARQPAVAHGIAEVPQLVVVWGPGTVALNSGSPHRGLTEVYGLDDLTALERQAFSGFGVYRVHRQIQGAVLAPAVRISG